MKQSLAALLAESSSACMSAFPPTFDLRTASHRAVSRPASQSTGRLPRGQLEVPSLGAENRVETVRDGGGGDVAQLLPALRAGLHFARVNGAAREANNSAYAVPIGDVSGL